MSDAVKVTVTDPDTGEVLGEQVLDDDYVVVCAGRRYLAHTDTHANGTHVLTLKISGPETPAPSTSRTSASNPETRPDPPGCACSPVTAPTAHAEVPDER